jgi:hypothetical protein
MLRAIMGAMKRQHARKTTRGDDQISMPDRAHEPKMARNLVLLLALALEVKRRGVRGAGMVTL